MSVSSVSQMRRGTRSCTECRRRKLRCSWTTENARKCRRCEERGLECLAQTASLSTIPKLNSKGRIGRLESQVDQLSRALIAVEARISHLPPTSHTPAPSIQPQVITEVSDDRDSDEEEDVSEPDDIVVQDDQHGMRGLFQNEWLGPVEISSPESRYSKTIRDSEDPDLAYARSKLQPLIPDREDVVALAGNVTGWSTFVAAMFPSFYLPPTEEQIVSSYDNMKSPSVDAWSLGNWLLVLALCAQQAPHDSSSPGQLLQSMRKRYIFANAVADTAEATILSHDRLLGTVSGLELSPGYLRVMMTRGRIQKTWLYLRRLISVAEFMGLPRLARAYDLQNNKGVHIVDEKYRYAKLWVSLCVIDRVISTLNGLPVATRMYSLPTMPEAQMTPEKQPLEHFIKLSNIAMEMQDMDEGRLSTAYPNPYSAVLKIDADLRRLAITIPSSWQHWTGSEISRAEIVTFMHNAVTLQLHVRFILRENDPLQDYTHSKIIGLQTCQLLTQLWRKMRQALPVGFFLFAIMDLQAFTAIVTMMLISATGYNEHAFRDIDREALAAQVEENYRIFEHNARQPYSSKFLRRAATTLESLRHLLSGDSTGDSTSPSIVLTVPMLGKVHVRKDTSRPQPFGGPARQSITKTGNIAKSIEAAMRPESYEAFSWMIEDSGETLFEDYLMMDDNEEWLKTPVSSF